MADGLNTAVSMEELVVNDNNMRKVHDTDPSLVASIAAAGLMYPITVKPIVGGKYEVIDGARRLFAIKAGIKAGTIEMNRVPVKIIENGLDSLEYSLHGNLHMAAHPLDEAEAISRLSSKEEEKAKIAQRFGKTVAWVDQRAKLNELCAEVKKVYREGGIDLEIAMAFTLGDHKMQKAVIKARQYESAHWVRRMLTQTKVAASDAIFDLTLYPADLVQRDLFSEDVWLTSIPKFLELQAKAFEDKIEHYKAKGYNDVVVIKSNDWQTINRYAAVQGKVKKETIGKLTVLLQLTEQGKFRVWENMIPNKEAKKVKQSAEGPGKTEEAEIIEKKAGDWTNLQGEFLACQGALDMVNEIEAGKVTQDTMDYILVMATIGPANEVGWIEGTRAGPQAERRWGGVKTSHPGLLQDELVFGFRGVTLDKWLAMPKADRQEVVRTAYASLIRAPHGNPKESLAHLPVKGWVAPDEAFFGRYRTDQLEDYLKKSGIKPKEHEGLKKGDLVKMCLKISKTPAAWKMGLG